MDVEDSLSLRLIKTAVLAIALVAFGYSIFLYYISTSQYVYSSSALPADSIPCYSNFTNKMKIATKEFSFDFFIITSQPIVIVILSITLSCCGSNLNQFLTLIISMVSFAAVGLYFIFRSGYYVLAARSCSMYWFCVTPCDSFGGVKLPTMEFTISQLTDYIGVIVALVAFLSVFVLRGVRRALVKRAYNGENIEANFKMLNEDESDE